MVGEEKSQMTHYYQRCCEEKETYKNAQNEEKNVPASLNQQQIDRIDGRNTFKSKAKQNL